MTAFDHDPILDTPHCPECHSKYFRGSSNPNPKKRVRECTACGHTWFGSDSLIIKQYQIGE